MKNDTTLPAAIGAAFGGGLYAGQINVDGKLFALIMAGAAGELSGRWNASNDSVAGALSIDDGMANTEAMASAGSKLAIRTLALSINGFEDWYIPSKNELEMLYRAFKPSSERNWSGYGENASSVPPGVEYSPSLPGQTDVLPLREDEPDALVPAWYWSSTQHASNPDRAWDQDFDYGFQINDLKSCAGRARAVRRLPI